LVVIFGENISFDHYFGTYPNAANTPGDPPFTAAASTPKANNLVTPLDPADGFTAQADAGLLTSNPTVAQAANGAGAVNPFRLGPLQAFTQDQNHDYTPEQQASDDGGMDLFPEYTGTAGPPPEVDGAAPDAALAAAATTGLVMAYFDGNTVSELWLLAQGYALNDNSWTSTFGPSTPGAINLISGQTNGIGETNVPPATMTGSVVPDGQGGYTLISDTDPLGDVCSTAAYQNNFVGRNVGDLLNAQKISWGWFMGGFDLSITNPNGTTGCHRSSTALVPNGVLKADYIPHHEPFQYYPSTANPNHLRPSSVSAIGSTLEADGVTPDPANHQYDINDFYTALQAGNFPAVSFLKAPGYQDAHAGYSDPLDEQNFILQVLTAVQQSGDWATTAVVFAYDDSDGWYDHQTPPIVNPSKTAADALNGPGLCLKGAQQGDGGVPSTPLLGAPPADGGAPYPAQGRCGYGTRLPLLVVSPYAKKNYIDHTLTDQTSVTKFIEDNWLGGQRVQDGGSFDTIAGSIENMFSF
jgi:phospholipase C